MLYSIKVQHLSDIVTEGRAGLRTGMRLSVVNTSEWQPGEGEERISKESGKEDYCLLYTK